MKKILLLLFTFCFCSIAKAQNTFEKVIDTLGNAGALCIQETFDGGYIFCGSSTIGGNHILINKIDSIGTIQWVKPYTGTGSDNVTYIEQTPDSGYIVNGSYDIGSNTKSWLLKLDVNGDTLWTKTFSAGISATQPSENNSMAVYNNAIYGLTGYYRTPVFPITTYAFFIGTLNNGSLLATKLYDTASFGTAGSAINKTNNGFIIGGGYAISTGVGDSYLIRVNPYGDTLWTKRYDYSTTVEAIKVVEQTSDSGFVLGGLIANINIGNQHNIFLIKTDGNGDTLWTKFYWQNFVENIYGLQQTTDGGFILTGYTKDTVGQTYPLMLMKTDTAGNIQWKKQYGSGSQGAYGTYVKQTKDGGYIICGLNNNVGIGTYLIKTDSMGNVLTGFENPELNNQISLMVFPNPAGDVITVRAKNISQKKSMLAIYNLTGQCVYNDKIINNEAKRIDVTGFTGGIYSLMLTCGDEKIIKKIAVYK